MDVPCDWLVYDGHWPPWCLPGKGPGATKTGSLGRVVSFTHTPRGGRLYSRFLYSGRRLFKDFRFTTLFLTGAVATFPLFVPVFFLPLYSASLGLSSLAGAGLVAAFQFSSFIGRLSGGFVADKAGPLNTLINSLLLNAVSMLVVWPFATSIGPLIVFTALNGVANGGFFATVPTVVGNIFGSARVAVAMGMIVTAWTGGYLLVRRASSLPRFRFVSSIFSSLIRGTDHFSGRADSRLYPRRRRRASTQHIILSPSHLLRRRHVRAGFCPGAHDAN